MINKDDLYIYDVSLFTESLYRMGNSSSPAFTEERAKSDVLIQKINGIDVVMANGNGFSAFNYLTPIMKRPGKTIWKIKKHAQMPQGLKLVKDLRPGHDGHFMIAPEKQMPLKKYLGLLEELGMDRVRVVKLSAMEVKNG
jgi:hypothetical protein